MKKVAYEDCRAMDYEEKRTVACLDMSGCDFRHIYVCKTLRFAENLQEVILSDTVLDPAFQVNCMGGGGTFADDEGVLCRRGEGSTTSHAYENRAPVARTSDRSAGRIRG